MPLRVPTDNRLYTIVEAEMRTEELVPLDCFSPKGSLHKSRLVCVCERIYKNILLQEDNICVSSAPKSYVLMARPYLCSLPQLSQRNVTAIRRCARCCCNILPILFAARADPTCCRFSSAHQKMLRHTASARSDVLLYSLLKSQTADSRMCPH